jgi:integrase/recombinase XerC
MQSTRAAVRGKAKDDKDVSLRDLLPEFEGFLVVERSLSDLSRKAYQFDVLKFIDFVDESRQGPIRTSDVTDKVVKGYINHCHLVRKYKPATLARAIASLRVFFLFCQRECYIPANPIARVQNPRRPKKMPIYLVDSELQRLIEAPDRTDPIGRRDYAIIMTLGMTGVRLRELVGMDVGDLEFEGRSMTVMGKGSKERMIPLNENVLSALREYLETREKVQRKDPLFLNRFGKRLSGRSVENIVKKYVELAGIEKENVSPHKLRHTFATLLHHHNVDLLEIKTLLGHQNLSTTQIYTHTNPARLKSAVGKLDYLRS